MRPTPTLSITDPFAVHFESELSDTDVESLEASLSHPLDYVHTQVSVQSQPLHTSLFHVSELDTLTNDSRSVTFDLALLPPSIQ